jgi:hypothetical protein
MIKAKEGHDHHFGQMEEPGLRFASSAPSRLRRLRRLLLFLQQPIIRLSSKLMYKGYAKREQPAFSVLLLYLAVAPPPHAWRLNNRAV